MERTHPLERTHDLLRNGLNTVANIGRFVIYQFSSGWDNLPSEANITVKGENSEHSETQS